MYLFIKMIFMSKQIQIFRIETTMIHTVEDQIIIINITQTQDILIKVHHILTIIAELILTNGCIAILTIIVNQKTLAYQLAIKIILRKNIIIK
jgi:hypothetical protein